MNTLPLPNRVWYSPLVHLFSLVCTEQHLLTPPRPLPAVGRCRLSSPRTEARARAAEDEELASERAAVVVERPRGVEVVEVVEAHCGARSARRRLAEGEQGVALARFTT